MKRTRLAAFVALIGLVAVACGGGETQTTSAAESSTSSAAATSPDALTTVSGTQIDLGSLEGQDTVLWFWAPW